jgi:hypothetical protein
VKQNTLTETVKALKKKQLIAERPQPL